MKEIMKGNKARYDGVLLTRKEYIEYKKLLETVQLMKEKKKEYMDTYHSGHMETFI